MKTRLMKLPTKTLLVATVAAFAMLAGSHATAYSIGHSDYQAGGERGRHEGSNGLRWWSFFNDKQPRHSAHEHAAAGKRSIGDWLDLHYPRRDDVIDEIISAGSIAQTGIDGRARLGHFKEKFLKGIMLVLRFKRHLLAYLEHNLEPEPVPLPAPILLLGSALFGLLTLYRRR